MLHCYFDCPPSKERPHCGCHGCLAGFPRPWFFARGGHVPASSSKFKGEPAAGIWVATRVPPRPARAVPLSSVTAAPRPHEDRKDADEEEEDEDEEAEEASQEIVEGNERIRKAGSGVRALRASGPRPSWFRHRHLRVPVPLRLCSARATSSSLKLKS